MSNADWYARRLGQQAPAPQQRHAPVQPYYQQPVAPNQYVQPQAVPGQHQMPQAPPPPGSVTHDNFMQMAAQWRGGPAMRTDPGGCPSCGSPRYYSRSKKNSRDPAPAPHCFDCGYNGLFDQGDPATWGAV